MSFFDDLFDDFFGDSKVECPRCLGKGHVDWNDIKRLNKELQWTPGSCAYCNGEGKVDPDQESKVPVDTTYLTTDLPPEERKRILNNEEDANRRAYLYEIQHEIFIDEINFLYSIGNLDTNVIVDFLEIRQHHFINTPSREELIRFVNAVISHSDEI